MSRARSLTCTVNLQVLLVTSSRRPDSWIVPGGGVEPEEEPAVTALREVREEAGVLGQLGRCLGTFEVITRDVCHTRYYVMLLRCLILFYIFLFFINALHFVV